MKTARNGVIVVLILAAGLALPAWFAKEGRAQTEGMKIGVVNLQGVFNGYTRKQAREDELTQLEQTKQAEIQAFADALNDKRDRINMMLAEDSEERQKAEQDLRADQVKLLIMRNVTELELKYHQFLYMKEIYSDILEEVKTFASQKHYDLVLKTEEVDMDAPNIEVLRRQIETHRVLYYSPDPGIDLTDTIIERLNARLAEGR